MARDERRRFFFPTYGHCVTVNGGDRASSQKKSLEEEREGITGMWTPRSLRSFVRRSEERRTRNAGHTTFTGIIAGSNEILLLHSRRPVPTQNQERIF